MSPQTRPDLVQVTFEVPHRLLGEFYIAVGAVLKQARGQSATDQGRRELHDWGTEAFDSELAHMAWRKFSPRAQAAFSLLMDNPGVAISADEIATKLGLANGRHGLAGVVAWPSRQCAEMGLTPPFRYENPAGSGETGSYWIDPQTAQLFIAAREEALAKNDLANR
jgi:Family of unknown function (DUF6416)